MKSEDIIGGTTRADFIHLCPNDTTILILKNELLICPFCGYEAQKEYLDRNKKTWIDDLRDRFDENVRADALRRNFKSRAKLNSSQP